MMSILARMAATALLVMTSSAATVAQESNPLIGEWQGVMRDKANVAMPFKVAYHADGTYLMSLAVPPKAGGGGAGFVITTGEYRISGPGMVDFNNIDSRVCAAGTNSCSPYPPGLGQGQFPFTMNGPNQYVSNGTVAYRVE